MTNVESTVRAAGRHPFWRERFPAAVSAGGGQRPAELATNVRIPVALAFLIAESRGNKAYACPRPIATETFCVAFARVPPLCRAPVMQS
jgi:hypothetical protein